MAKRTTRTRTSANSEPAKASNDSATYASGPGSVLDRAPGGDGPAHRRADPDGDSTRNDSMGSEPSEEEIRIRAYRRFMERGGSDGQDFDDWLEAERELKQPR